jgi:hypothetical protein
MMRALIIAVAAALAAGSAQAQMSLRPTLALGDPLIPDHPSTRPLRR